MSLVSSILWLTVGVFGGLGLVLAFAGGDTLRPMLLRRILRSNRDGWALIQRGNRYDLQPMDRDDESKTYLVHNSDGEPEYLEDPADQLHTMEGVPLGLALEGERPLVDVETAAAAEGAAEAVADGGWVSPDEELSLQEMQDRHLIGRSHGEGRTFYYVNPFVNSKSGEVVDLRDITKLLRNETKSDTPRKTAKNAQEAERSFDSYSGLRKNLGRVGYLMIGGILTYIGTTSGGGGGGGGTGVSVPVQLVTDVVLGVM